MFLSDSKTACDPLEPFIATDLTLKRNNRRELTDVFTIWYPSAVISHEKSNINFM